MQSELLAHQRAEFLASLHAVGLGHRADELAAVLKPAIALKSRPVQGPDLQPGRSRLGGEPDLPADVPWPLGAEGPLIFVLQVDLSQIAPFDFAGLLPNSGLLSVFSDRWARDVRVLHLTGPVARRPWAIPEHGPFSVCGLDIAPELQPPPPASAFVGGEEAQVQLTSEEHDIWWDEVWLAWRERFRPGPAGACGVHQLLGYAAAERLGDAQGRDEEVLVGFDSDDRAGMEWGDVHAVWALIDRNDLRSGSWHLARAEM